MNFKRQNIQQLLSMVTENAVIFTAGVSWPRTKNNFPSLQRSIQPKQSKIQVINVSTQESGSKQSTPKKQNFVIVIPMPPKIPLIFINTTMIQNSANRHCLIGKYAERRNFSRKIKSFVHPRKPISKNLPRKSINDQDKKVVF